jgi:hypothetical protein
VSAPAARKKVLCHPGTAPDKAIDADQASKTLIWLEHSAYFVHTEEDNDFNRFLAD